MSCPGFSFRKVDSTFQSHNRNSNLLYPYLDLFSLNTMRDKSPSGHSLIFRISLPLNKGEILSSSWINKNQHYISVGSESQMRWSVPRLLPWIVATRVCIAYQTNYCSCYTWTTLSLLTFQNTLLEYQFYFSPLRWTQRFLVIAFPRGGLFW